MERLRDVHQRGDVAHRADVHLAAWQESHGAREINRETALDPANDGAVNLLTFIVGHFQMVPGLFPAGFLAADDRIAQGIFNALQKHLDRVANGDFLTRLGEFAGGDPAFGL